MMHPSRSAYEDILRTLSSNRGHRVKSSCVYHSRLKVFVSTNLRIMNWVEGPHRCRKIHEICRNHAVLISCQSDFMVPNHDQTQENVLFVRLDCNSWHCSYDLDPGGLQKLRDICRIHFHHSQ